MEGDFRIDQWLVQPLLNTIVSPDATSVQLEPKVMEVLVYLADRPGEVVSKESLLQALWEDTFVTENVLTRCIAELRKVLRDDAAEPKVIQTITKKGYRLIAQVSKLKAPASRYEVLHKLGQGAVGEVLLAKDTELHRKVALKFVLEEKGSDETGRKRLLREARAAAALDHPFICKIFDTGEIGGKTFIAMEYVEGQTLKQELARGRFETKDALRIASEIAEALESAHDKGIVHRDLKPSNIMITPQGHVKVMDFGLAKRLPQADMSASLEETVSALTKEGTTAGTLPYMSPEQLRAETIDSRSDIFSFGIVLFEMIAGSHPFEKKSAVETAAAILDAEPDWNLLPSGTSALIRALLRRCLQKDRSRRQHDIADARIEIDDAQKHPPGPGQMTIAGLYRRRSLAALILTTALLLTVAVGLTLWRARLPAAARPMLPARMNISFANSGLTLTDGGLAISPDGQTVVFAAASVNEERLYLRHIDDWEPHALKNTEGARNPFFSPDGEWIAFSVRRRTLQKVPLRGGPAQTICVITGQRASGVWGPDHRIIFCQWPNAGLWSVSDEGGRPELLIAAPDSATFYRWPCLLPLGESVMFSVLTGQISRIDVLSLRTKHVTTLIPSGVRCRYLPTGHLIYESQGHLRAIGFDPERLQTRGSARLVIDDVGQAEGIWGIADYDVSETGNLVCMPTWLDTLVWKDRQGSAVPLKINPRRYGGSPALSPDGRSLAVVVKEGPARHLWFGSVDGEPLTRLTFDSDNTSNLFMPTGKAVLFSSMQGGRYNIFRVPTNMPGKIERLTDGPSSQKPTSISPLGNVLLFNESDETGGIHISHMEIGKPGTARPFVKSRFHEFEGVFSPDGRWVAYQSDESGRYEVYVRPYGGSGERRQVSVDGGIAPAWNPRGGELFYQTPTALMARRVENGIPVSEPTRLFWQRWHGFNAREYDVSGDGQRFLMYEPAGDPSSRLNLVLNWLEELKRLVPTGKK